MPHTAVRKLAGSANLKAAGTNRPIFSEQDVSALATLTRSMPRLINDCYISCLLDACTQEPKTVDEASVRRVDSEFDDAQRAAAGW